jgi:hypothetical protein
MATEKLGIVIDATVKGKREVEGLNKELEGVGKTAPRAGASLGDLAKGAAAAGIAFYAIKEAAGFAMQKIGEGAELEAARGRFDNLAESINITGDALLGKLRTATSGMVSDAELVASATDIISLGLAKNEEDVSRLATVISTLGLDMQQVIMTFANNSTMRLDALGLSVEDVTNKAKELEENGFQGDAFDEAVLIALEEKMTLLGDAVETTSGKISIIKAGFQDMGDAAKSALAQGVEPLINGLANQFMAQDVLKGLYDDGTISGMQYVRMLGMMTTNATGARMVSNEINKILAEQNTQTTRGKQATEEYAIALDDLANAGRDAQNVQNTQIAITEKASEATHEHVYSLEELARMGRDAMPEAMENMAAAEASAAEETRRLKLAHDEAREALEEHAAMMGDLFVGQLERGEEATFDLMESLFQQADQAGASAETMALLAIATGDYTDAQVKAALEAAIMEEKIRLLAEEVASGKTTIEEAVTQIGLMEEGLRGAAGMATAAATGLERLREEADKLDGRQVNVNVNVTRTGELPSGLGGGGGDKPNDKVGSDSPKETRASGGPVFAGNAYLVGEQGPEVVVMGSNGTVIPNNSLGGTVINIDARGAAMGTGPHIAQHVKMALNQQGRRADMRIRTR